jgi:hypothetical protein
MLRNTRRTLEFASRVMPLALLERKTSDLDMTIA